jgi:predicted Zn-dependent peptidase
MTAPPDLGLAPALPTWPYAESLLDNGLTVIAVAHPTVPLVELKLRIPFAPADPAAGSLLGQTLFSGTATIGATGIAAAAQEVGGSFTTSLDAGHLLVSASCVRGGLHRLLDLLAGVLRGASYPEPEFDSARTQVAGRLHRVRRQQRVLARDALLRRMYGAHPHAAPTPAAGEVRAVTVERIRSLHREAVRPDGAVLVLVGDLDLDRTMESAVTRLGAWRGAGSEGAAPAVTPPAAGPLLVVDWPGSVQSSLRMALPAAGREDPDHAPLMLANLVFGGCFSSRWVENIREDKGFAYSAVSYLHHPPTGPVVLVNAEVAAEATGAAYVETLYELGRLATSPPTGAEVEQARRYARGTLLLGTATQAGLARTASLLAGAGLRLDFLYEHDKRLATATVEDVARAAAGHLAPTGAVSVVLGAADRIAPDLARVTAIDIGEAA